MNGGTFYRVFAGNAVPRSQGRTFLKASPVLRARAGELQNEVAELEREIAAETATLKGRTAVGEWREAKRYLLHIDIGALWMASTVEEQPELLDAVFRKIEAAPDRMNFHIRGAGVPGRDAVAETQTQVPHEAECCT